LKRSAVSYQLSAFSQTSFGFWTGWLKCDRHESGEQEDLEETPRQAELQAES